jgi:hypothetical protein
LSVLFRRWSRWSKRSTGRSTFGRAFDLSNVSIRQMSFVCRSAWQEVPAGNWVVQGREKDWPSPRSRFGHRVAPPAR